MASVEHYVCILRTQCYKPAQVNLLHTLSHAPTTGCVLVLTGDYHYSDIKLVRPGADHVYSESLQTGSLDMPIWQFMASGMSTETAHHAGEACEGSFRKDLVGLRPLGPCSFYSGPNFGVIDIDWAAKTVSLQIHDIEGAVASDVDGKRQEMIFSLETCLPV